MKTKEIEKAGRHLQNHLPLLGSIIRRTVVKRLVKDSSSETIKLLAIAVNSFDLKIAEIAYQGLISLKSQKAIDSLCSLWFETRDKSLEKIILASGFIAQVPLNVRIATALKQGKTELCIHNEAVESLVNLMDDGDIQIKENAKKALLSLHDREAIDFLCEGILQGKYEQAKEIVILKGYVPSNVSRRSLFLVLNGQIEQYFELDFEFEHLRAEYLASPPELQQRIRIVIQESNDPRLMGLFGEVRRRIIAKDLTEHEAGLMLEIYTRNKQFAEVFALLFFAPLAVVPDAISTLVREGWQPSEEVEQTLFSELVKVRAQMDEKPVHPDEPEVALGPVFTKWVEKGKREYISKPENELRTILKNGIPPEAVAALSAMITLKLANDEDRKFVSNHPHWLVRMAVPVLAETRPELLLTIPSELSGGGEYWLQNSPRYTAKKFLQLHAASMNPEMLQELSKATGNRGNLAETMNIWRILLLLLGGYTLRNIIAIGAYEKQIDDSAISL